MSMRDNSAQTTSLSAESANELPSVVANLLTSEIETPNKREIPFAIGLDSLPVAARTQTNLAEVVPGSSGGIFPPGSGANSAINAEWGNLIQDGYFNADMSAKQIICEMTVFQSCPVIEADGTITNLTDATSLADGAGTNLGELAYTKVNSGQCGYRDDSSFNFLLAWHNGGVKNYKVGAAISLIYVDAWIRKFFPELYWKEGSDRMTKKFGRVRSGGFSGKLLAKGLLWAEVVFPISNTESKVLKIKIVDNCAEHTEPRLDIMPSFCLINSHRDIFSITGSRKGKNKIDGSKIAFLFQDCNYDYINGEIVGYGPENVYKKFYPYSSKLFEDSKSILNYNKVFLGMDGKTVGGPKSKRVERGLIIEHSLVKVRFFIDPSAKEQAEKILGIQIPEELMKVNYSA